MTWLVAHLSKDAPKTVYQSLVDGGHGPFIPEYPEMVTFRGKLVKQMRPLIPRYVFLRYTHRWPEANMKGCRVLAYTNSGGYWEPHILPDDFLDRVQKPTKPESPSAFRYGAWVRITVGAATGCFGRVKEVNKGKVSVGVDFMGGERVFYIPTHTLELADPSNADRRGASTAAKIA